MCLSKRNFLSKLETFSKATISNTTLHSKVLCYYSAFKSVVLKSYQTNTLTFFTFPGKKQSFKAMEAKASKLAKTDGFKRSLPFMTATALAAVVDKIKQEGLPPVSNRKVFTTAALAGLQGKGYGPVITTMKVHCKDGSSRDLYMANPLALPQAAYSQRGSYYNLVQATLQKHPSNLNKCWDAIFYMDGAQGGNH